MYEKFTVGLKALPIPPEREQHWAIDIGEQYYIAPSDDVDDWRVTSDVSEAITFNSRRMAVSLHTEIKQYYTNHDLIDFVEIDMLKVKV